MGGTKKLEAEITANKNNRRFEEKKPGVTLKHVCFICTHFVIEMSINISFRIQGLLFSFSPLFLLLLSFLISCVNYNEEKMIMQLCK